MWRKGYGMAIETSMIYSVPEAKLVVKEAKGARHFARGSYCVTSPDHPGLLALTDTELLEQQAWLATMCRR